MGRKTTIRTLKAINKRHFTRKKNEHDKERNPKRETESLQTTAQNNVIRTNYIKERID